MYCCIVQELVPRDCGSSLVAWHDFEQVLSELCVDGAQFIDMCSDASIMQGNNYNNSICCWLVFFVYVKSPLTHLRLIRVNLVMNVICLQN